MSLFNNKNWIAQEFYNEYLDLKTEISELINSRHHFDKCNEIKEVQELQETIDIKVDRLRFILNQLSVAHGIALEDLILLSIGVDV